MWTPRSALKSGKWGKRT